ncbi:uncharacterized protein [Rutidosis leptorrhynchoides]|uniref:uncharacterized protein n=1 Tax=Rutidosis leptorrhynchoides TaxID=125765 RepID=UPI003A99E662
MIPQGVIEEIDKILKEFLWNQDISSKGKAKVAWKQVCYPKDQGGLGLRPLKEWNAISLVKEVWRILAKKESLWGKWVNVVKLNGRDFWSIQPCYHDSWGWKILLNFREKIKPHIVTDFRDGREELRWLTNEGKKVHFSTHQVWKDLRSNKPKVVWHHIVWFKFFEPKHAFILWLAILNRLSTQDRMQMSIWVGMKRKMIFKGLPNQLNGIVECLAKYPYSNKIWCTVNRIMLAACVYFVWNERNCRLFRNQKRSADVLCTAIEGFIQMKLLTLKVKDSDHTRMVARVWSLDWNNDHFHLK